jgi:hypothetical protein
MPEKATILEKMKGSEVGAEPEIRDEKGDLVVCTSLTLYITLNSQTDDYRMMRHLSLARAGMEVRRYFLSTGTRRQSLPFSLTQPPLPLCNPISLTRLNEVYYWEVKCSVCQKYERYFQSGYLASSSSFPSSRSLSIFRRILIQR